MMAGLALPFATATNVPAAASPQVPGTDVSNLTTVTSWQNVADAGVKFVGIEAIQGKTIPNTQYSSQVTGATGAKLFVMPYVFADPGKLTAADQFTDAWNVISAVPAVPYARGGLMLPVALDMERDDINFPGQPCYGLNTADMISWISGFISAAKAKTSAAPIIYSNPNWWSTCTGNTTAFNGDPLWIANYDVSSPAIPPGWPGYTFWQSSPSGTINGISGTGHADLDQMQGAPASLFARSGSIGSFQVKSLQGLAGQSVSYTATGLSNGMSLSSSGLFSWPSTVPVGAYPVTVTPTDPTVIPSSASFTLRVHGSITITTGNHSSTAGTPIVLRVPTSGPDQTAGFAPTLKATGLPTGLTMNSTGLITGWPSKPGTFKVTATASDGLGGTGSTSFTWTVNAAADSGTTGTIRQVGGSGKCLNDPGGATANGTLPTMWTCDGKSFQQWTTVQDGTIRVAGKCLDMAGNGSAADTAVRLWTCNSGDTAQQWQVGSTGELVNPSSGKCLYVPVNSAANGTKPTVHACANDSRHHWLRPAAPVASGNPGKCMAVSGSAVVLATCASTAAQHWTAQSDGTLRLGGKCLTETAATPSSALSVGSCSGAAATRWKLVPAGPIATELSGAAAGLCATASSSAVGAKLVIQSCASTPAATWHVE